MDEVANGGCYLCGSEKPVDEAICSTCDADAEFKARCADQLIAECQ